MNARKHMAKAIVRHNADVLSELQMLGIFTAVQVSES
jgi:hypothetical protein